MVCVDWLQQEANLVGAMPIASAHPGGWVLEKGGGGGERGGLVGRLSNS